MYELYNGNDGGFEEEYKELKSDLSLESLIPAIIATTKQMRSTHIVQKVNNYNTLSSQLKPETILNLQIGNFQQIIITC